MGLIQYLFGESMLLRREIQIVDDRKIVYISLKTTTVINKG